VQYHIQNGAASAMMPAHANAAMSKKSLYTDQTQPPYFRLDAQQHKSYFVRAEQRVKDLIAAAPSGMALHHGGDLRQELDTSRRPCSSECPCAFATLREQEE